MPGESYLCSLLNRLLVFSLNSMGGIYSFNLNVIDKNHTNNNLKLSENSNDLFQIRTMWTDAINSINIDLTGRPQLYLEPFKSKYNFNFSERLPKHS